MHRRRLTALVALLGVLLHAAVLVRHNGVMLKSHLQHAGLVAALSVICHGSGVAEQQASLDQPAPPAPSDTQSECPICAGLLSAVVDIPQQVSLEMREYAVSLRIAHVAEITAPRLRTIRPPTRAPPFSA